MRGVDLLYCVLGPYFYPHAVGFASVLIWLEPILSCLVAVDTIFGALKKSFFVHTLVIFPAKISLAEYTQSIYCGYYYFYLLGKGP